MSATTEPAMLYGTDLRAPTVPKDIAWRRSDRKSESLHQIGCSSRSADLGPPVDVPDWTTGGRSWWPPAAPTRSPPGSSRTRALEEDSARLRPRRDRASSRGDAPSSEASREG